MIDSARTPNALMSVVVISVISARKTPMLKTAIGESEARSVPKMLDSTSGTVIATAVVVRTPAQK